MGLDMYLYKKSARACDKGSTGACGGLFPLAPKSEGMEEIGYWRKAYAVCDFIFQQLGKNFDESNLEKLYMSEKDIQAVLSEAKWHIEEEVFEDDWEEEDWKDTINIMELALKAIRNEDASIFFEVWY